MTARQDPRITDEYRRLQDEFSRYRQAAGLSATLDPTYDRTPDDYRRTQVRMLQNALPHTTPASVRADATGTPADVFARTEAKVKEAVLAMAASGNTLRAVTLRDKTGREITEFVGAKRSWMNQYTAAPLLMKKLGNAEY